MELTKEYFDEKLSQLVTRDDLDQRLKNVATKDDLQRFATKDDLLELATKNDLNAVRDQILEVKAMVKRIDQRTDEDHRAALTDLVELKTRVSVLERSTSRQ